MNPIRPMAPALAAALLACAGTATAQAARPAAAPKPAQTAATQATTRPAPASAASGLRAEPVPPQVDAAFKAFDTDHDGALSLAEFRSGWQAMRRGGARTARDGLRHQFDELDANNNGGIDRTEYPNMVLVKRAGSAAPPFSEFDRDRSQKLEYAEYTALVQRLSARRTGAAMPRK